MSQYQSPTLKSTAATSKGVIPQVGTPPFTVPFSKPASSSGPEVRAILLHRLATLPSPRRSQPLGGYKSPTLSPDNMSTSSFGSSSTLTFGAATDMPYAVRQPIGPRDPGNNAGFHWKDRDCFTGRPNKLSQQPTADNNAALCPPVPVQGPLVSTHQSTEMVSAPRSSNFQPIVSSNFHQHTKITGVDQHQTDLGYVPLTPAIATKVMPYSQPESRGISNFRTPQQLHITPASVISKRYRPSTQVLQEKLASREPARPAPGTSYQGDGFASSYLNQVVNLPDHLNAALWMEYLPSNIQPYQIFDALRGYGVVWSLHINPPTDTHPTAAAKIVFMSPHADARIMAQYRIRGLQVGGSWVRLKYNKHGMPNRSTSETRVLRIEGPQELMSLGWWEAQFCEACKYQIDRWGFLPCVIAGRARMEFRFARVDGQAQSCRQMIERELASSHGILVWYGPDPCGEIGN
ncbi:hypothetical protein BDZ45DRAFT_621443 [Acephala macrosclerotiorum]|nr:hypothetical protein BDZ45DRAFT_621443 [Acephala macrosclerotiorum]